MYVCMHVRMFICITGESFALNFHAEITFRDFLAFSCISFVLFAFVCVQKEEKNRRSLPSGKQQIESGLKICLEANVVCVRRRAGNGMR